MITGRQQSKPLVPSPQQQAVIDEVVGGNGHIIVRARAGCGKSSNLLMLLPYLQGSVFMGAFNVAIKKELEERVTLMGMSRPDLSIKTIHAAGLAAYKYGGGSKFAKVEGRKVHFIIDELAHSNPDYSTYFDFLSKLTSLGKRAGIGPLLEDTDQSWLDLIEHYGVDEELPDVDDDDEEERLIQRLLGLTRVIYKTSLDRCPDELDFDDMMLAPLAIGARFQRHDWVVVDECFIGDTPILLADGTMSPISELVASQYAGRVYTMTNAGKVVTRRVVGWHKIPLSKRLVRIVSMRRGFTKSGTKMSPITEACRYGKRIIVCTEDHRIRVNGGWMRAASIKPGDRLIEESITPRPSAHYNHRYKIGEAGRRTLGSLMDKKNKSGVCGSSHAQGAYIPAERRGGNGKGPTKVEAALLERLGDDWNWNHVVPVGKGRGHGYPTHYKIDLANPEMMIGIEVDGHSHDSAARHAQDVRKDELLTSFGWTIFRMSNQEAMEMSEEMLNEFKANSPVESEVRIVDTWTPEDPYVYDLEVEDTHCYFANGILVHNCQDLSAIRREIALRMLKPGGRMVVVGDEKQSVYGFCGAESNVMELMEERLKEIGPSVTTLPLTVTYRCPKSVVALANQWVPDLEAHPSAPEGIVRSIPLEREPCSRCHGDAEIRNPSYVAGSDASPLEYLECPDCGGRGSQPCFWDEAQGLGAESSILCRTNRPIVELAYKLLRKGIPCQIAGRDFAGSLIKLCQKWRVRELSALERKLFDYKDREAARWRKKRNEERAAGVEDKVDTVLCLLDAVRSTGKSHVSDLIDKINAMFGDVSTDEKPKVLTLSSQHKSKGLGWQRVYILGRHTYQPSRWAVKPWQIQQEQNLLYVAVSRSAGELIDIVVK